jgi:hypothetical protein
VVSPYVPASTLERQPGWSWLDEYLWVTCDIIADLAEGRLGQRKPVATTTRLALGERALAIGPAHRLTWRALGDGRYYHENVVAFGSPAYVLGGLAASAIGNSSRRRAAAKDAQPRWVMDGSAEVTITTHKIYFGHARNSLNLGWDGLDEIDLVAPEVFQTSFRDINNKGQRTTVQLHTPWASLLFVLGAVTGFPSHPRLLERGWLPPDFEQRCLQMGRPCRPAANLLLNRGR